jgi:hypothetical protein
VQRKAEFGSEFRYGITARINHITSDIAELLSKTGCVSVFMGLETGSDRLQDSSAKHLALETVLPRLRNLLRLGIHVSTNFILGFPDETMADLEKTIALMLAVRWSGADVNISVMCPEPGSALNLTTPKDKQIILHTGKRCDELRAGGVQIELMKPAERMHLVAVANENFDIVEIAAVARTIQLLMGDYPATLFYLWSSLGGSSSLFLTKLWRLIRCRGEVQPDDAFEEIILLFQPSESEAEIALYESALAMRKRDSKCSVPISVFSPGIGDRYNFEINRIAAGGFNGSLLPKLSQEGEPEDSGCEFEPSGAEDDQPAQRV